MYEIWDIVILNFSPTKWMEINKIRPALVISNNIINTNSPYIIVAPITSNTQNILFSHILLERCNYNFLDCSSKVILEQLKSIDKTRIIKKIWKLWNSDIINTKDKLKFCFSLS